MLSPDIDLERRRLHPDRKHSRIKGHFMAPFLEIF